MNKSEKEMRALQDKQESEILRRVLFWLGAAVLLETLVLLGNRFYFHYLTTEIEMAIGLVSVFKVLQFAGFIVAAGFLLWSYQGRRKTGQGGICRLISAAFFAAISACTILFLYIGAACVSILLVTIPATAGLIMIYYLYQREFCILATITGFGILGLWVFRAANGRFDTFYYIYTALAVLLAVAISIFVYQLKKGDGSLKLKARSIAVLKSGASYKAVWISCAISAASLVLAPILGTAFAYYAFLLLIIWVFVMAVYFTSRLM